MKFRVHAQTVASLSQTVEIEESALTTLATDLGKSIDELTISDMEELVTDKFYQECDGTICAQDSGWGKNYSLDLGEYEIDEKGGIEQIV